MLIREMTLSDIEFAFGLVSEEGWASETREVFETFLEYNPAGCFIAEDDSGGAGMCVAVRYPRSGFFGELIVKREARGKGYGTALFRGSRAFRETDPCWRMEYGPHEEPGGAAGGLFAIGSGAKG